MQKIGGCTGISFGTTEGGMPKRNSRMQTPRVREASKGHNLLNLFGSKAWSPGPSSLKPLPEPIYGREVGGSRWVGPDAVPRTGKEINPVGKACVPSGLFLLENVY